MEKLTPGTVHVVHIQDFPWTDSWAKNHHGFCLMPELECKQRLEGQEVLVLPNIFDNIAVAGDRGKIKSWLYVRALTGPCTGQTFGVATDWLTVVSVCSCTDKVIWSKGCQCGGI